LKTLILIMAIPTLVLGWELPPGLELVSVDGDHLTVRNIRTGMMDIYLIEGEPVINGWALDPADDSLIFELVADLNMYLIANLQSYDFMNDGYPELIGTDLISDFNILFLENTENFNFSEVNRIFSERILYDMGDGEVPGLIVIDRAPMEIEQIVMMETLHLFATSFFAGKAAVPINPDTAPSSWQDKVVEEGDGEAQKLALPPAPECPPERKQQVEAAINAYVANAKSQ